MQQQIVYKIITALLLSSSLFLAGCSDDKAEEISQRSFHDEKAANPDVIARVGDEVISFSELNTLLNSSAIVGLSVPALGTPERNRVRITLLDKLVSANLLYLDALKHGMDKDPVYVGDMQQFTDGVLAALYRQQHLIGEIEITDAEVQEFFENSIMPGTKMTDDIRLGIEATIRKQRFKARTATMQARLREGVEVNIDESVLDSAGDDEREDAAVVASIDGEPVRWEAVKELLVTESKRTARAEFHLDEDEERARALNGYIDTRIMAKKGRTAGLEQDPVYQRRFKEIQQEPHDQPASGALDQGNGSDRGRAVGLLRGQ